MIRIVPLAVALAVLALLSTAAPAADDTAESKIIVPISQRFSAAAVDEVPDFQKHLSPLMGKLGCNGRACHGSFQGQGGFRLSLFGYDFKMDHENLTQGDEPRVDREFAEDSLALLKPTLEVPHRGGKRMEIGRWEYNVFLKWIQGGAKGTAREPLELVRLDVTPQEILFNGKDETTSLRAVAVWADGTREDVTELCRFQTNDEQVATVDDHGLVAAAEAGDTHVVVFYDKAVVPVPVLRPMSDKSGPRYPATPTPTQIDQLVVDKLRKLGIVQSETCTDAEFLRRASLDITGTLPTAAEVEQFLADESSDKRARKIDELLERPGYAAWWATLLCDFTGNNTDALNNLSVDRNRASQEWYDWIEKRVADNVPYDELAAGIILATSRNDGESYEDYCESMSRLYHNDSDAEFADRQSMPHYWARRTFRNPDDRVVGFAYAFLGIRIQCAQCHKHPFDQWSQDDFKQFTGFFRGTNYGSAPGTRDDYQAMLKELGFGDEKRNNNQLRRELAKLLQEGKTVPFQEVFAIRAREQRPSGRRRNQRANNRAPVSSARVLGGETIDLTQYDDPRQPLMDWLRSKDNPYFARAFVNRVWANYFNVGIVEPPDDLSLANPPSNKPLLDYLTEGFIVNGYDMKWLHREIVGSRTYQLSWRPNDTNRLDEKNFSRAVPRRMPAEVAYDALQSATASNERAAEFQRSLEGRGIAVAGYGQRNNAAARGSGYALMVFGKSIRESNCDCDRSLEPSLLQTVYLRNDSDVQTMIDRRDGWLNDLTGSARGGGRSNDEARAGRRMIDRKLAQGIRRTEAQIRRLRKAGDDEKAEGLQQRLAQLRRMARRGAGRNDDQRGEPAQADSKKLAALDAQDVVRQAYLRTVSRYPTDDELQRAVAYIDDAKDKVDGIRGVLWALLNTKEFIVNH